MNELEDLVAQAQKQLAEHRVWLMEEIGKISSEDVPAIVRFALVAQASQIKLRVAKVAGLVASVVYEYPDELAAFLRSDKAPEHLRASVSSGHVVDPNKPSFEVRREPSDG